MHQEKEYFTKEESKVPAKSSCIFFMYEMHEQSHFLGMLVLQDIVLNLHGQ